MITKLYMIFLICIACNNISFAQQKDQSEFQKKHVQNDTIRQCPEFVSFKFAPNISAIYLNNPTLKIAPNYFNFGELKVSPIASYIQNSDYAIYSSIGKFQTFSTFQSLPLIGAYSYIRFLYPISISNRITMSFGGYIGKYLIGKKTFNDAGYTGCINYLLSPNLSINLEYQNTFSKSSVLAPQVKSIYPHSNTDFNIQIKPKDNIKLKIGILND